MGMTTTPQEAQSFWERRAGGSRRAWADISDEEPEATGTGALEADLRSQVQALTARVERLEAALAKTATGEAAKAVSGAPAAVRANVADVVVQTGDDLPAGSGAREEEPDALTEVATEEVPPIAHGSERDEETSIEADEPRAAAAEDDGVDASGGRRRRRQHDDEEAHAAAGGHSYDPFVAPKYNSERSSATNDFEEGQNATEEDEFLGPGAASSSAWVNAYVHQPGEAEADPDGQEPAAGAVESEMHEGCSSSADETPPRHMLVDDASAAREVAAPAEEPRQETERPFLPARASRATRRRRALAASFPTAHVEAIRNNRISNAGISIFQDLIRGHEASARAAAAAGDNEGAGVIMSCTRDAMEIIQIERQLRRDDAARARGLHGLL